MKKSPNGIKPKMRFLQDSQKVSDCWWRASTEHGDWVIRYMGGNMYLIWLESKYTVTHTTMRRDSLPEAKKLAQQEHKRLFETPPDRTIKEVVPSRFDEMWDDQKNEQWYGEWEIYMPKESHYVLTLREFQASYHYMLYGVLTSFDDARAKAKEYHILRTVEFFKKYFKMEEL